MNNGPLTLFWFRRDLRLHDNRGLFEALKYSPRVLPLFILDEDIVGSLPASDHRVAFIYSLLEDLHHKLQEQGGGLRIEKGRPFEVVVRLLRELDVEAVFANGDHEPYGLERDEKIRALLDSKGISFHLFTDHLVFGKNELLKADGSPYQVFTPYSRQWKSRLKDRHLNAFPSENITGHFLKTSREPLPALEQWGFRGSGFRAAPYQLESGLLARYDQTRDFPALEGTSRLGPWLRFGAVGIREVLRMAVRLNETFLNELIWREFYAMILWHHPRVISQSFKPGFDRIAWENNEAHFTLWKDGRTGYPMVDAGMRQLAATGYMHNRLRMITASFLAKHLMIDWRWGEAWFAQWLFDYELSSNNGGWQWSAGTGCDAAPYFRVFNPAQQQKKFDPEATYIQHWVPEWGTPGYPAPVVDHRTARARWLKEVKAAVG
jgi:deoxyribodipyrimidine photo-lyase